MDLVVWFKVSDAMKVSSNSRFRVKVKPIAFDHWFQFLQTGYDFNADDFSALNDVFMVQRNLKSLKFTSSNGMI